MKGHRHTLNEEENIWLQNGGKYKSLAEAQLQIRLSVPKKEVNPHLHKPPLHSEFSLCFPFLQYYTQCCTLILPVHPAVLGAISFLFVTPCCYVGPLIRVIYVHWIKLTSIQKEKILLLILNFTVI